jgi:molybdenum cofactor biosynthesis enzyme MoaA
MPEYIAIEVTNVCNFRCKFCPQSDPNHHHVVPKSYLDPETCALFLQKIRDAGITTNLMHWTLDGEPFMHKGFAELVRISAEYGFTNTHFASNGMLCTVDRLMEW